MPKLLILIMSAFGCYAQTVVTQEVVTVRLTMKCNKCGGEMRHTGIILTSYPPQYPHFCAGCKTNSVTLWQLFPRIDYVEKPATPPPQPMWHWQMMPNNPIQMTNGGPFWIIPSNGLITNNAILVK